MKKTLLMAALLLVCITATACAGLKADTKVLIMPKQHVAYTEYVGDYEQHPEQFEELLTKLLTWADARKLLDSPDEIKLITLLPDELGDTPVDRRRMQVAINVPEGTRPSGQVKTMVIPGGRYGIGRFTVSDDEVGDALTQMFEKWLPESGYSLGKGPFYLVWTNDPETHPEKKNIVDIYIPVS